MPDIEYYIDYRKQVIAQIFLENTNNYKIVYIPSMGRKEVPIHRGKRRKKI